MKTIYLIHGYKGRPKDGWRPWLKNKLKKKKFNVIVPLMPNTKHPKMNAWLKHLTKVVKNPDKDCYFVGHSLGCITILRYLETINRKVGGVVLVAGFSDDLGRKDILGSFFTKPIKWSKIKSNCKKFVAIHSDNDQYVSLKYANIFKKKLNVKLIVKHAMKHFSGDDGILKLPVVLKELMVISK